MIYTFYIIKSIGHTLSSHTLTLSLRVRLSSKILRNPSEVAVVDDLMTDGKTLLVWTITTLLSTVSHTKFCTHMCILHTGRR